MRSKQNEPSQPLVPGSITLFQANVKTMLKTQRSMWLALIGVQLALALGVCAAKAKEPYLFGVLIGNPAHLKSDHAAGIRLVLVESHWSRYEPEPGKYDIGYRDELVRTIERYRAAGFRVAMTVGVHYTPAWICNNPRLQHLSQLPGVTSGLANFTFDQSLRDQAEKYIADVVKHMGPVDYYRVGLNAQGETLYPEAPHGEWWAFDRKAQGDDPGRPASIPPPPLLHWVPGTPYQGRTVTVKELQQWYDWYFNALVDSHDWEIRAHRQAGFQGMIQLPMPGQGVRPSLYRRRIANCLAPTSQENPDGYHTMNTGAVWFLFLDHLADRRNLVVDISSVGDRSGEPLVNGAGLGEDRVDYMHDPQIERWSSTRWISFHARRLHLPVIGENPGHNDRELMHKAVQLMMEYGLTGIMWAFDDELYSGKHATIDDYASEIRAANVGVKTP